MATRLTLRTFKHKKRKVSNISKCKQCLSNVRWGEVLDDIDVNQDYNTFVTKFQELYDECISLKNVPCSKRKRDPKLPWITKGLLHLTE